MEKVKGATTCVVCGREFPLIIEEHYTARDPEKKGVLPALTGQEESVMWDAFDCPHCGCQNIMQPRKPEVCPCDYGICDECGCEEEEEEDPAPEPKEQECNAKTPVAEMVDFLMAFCNKHECIEGKCPLCTKDFCCGRGKWFDTKMSDEEIKAAYKVARDAK